MLIRLSVDCCPVVGVGGLDEPLSLKSCSALSVAISLAVKSIPYLTAYRVGKGQPVTPRVEVTASQSIVSLFVSRHGKSKLFIDNISERLLDEEVFEIFGEEPGGSINASCGLGSHVRRDQHVREIPQPAGRW